jgi:hypothetical protein
MPYLLENCELDCACHPDGMEGLPHGQPALATIRCRMHVHELCSIFLALYVLTTGATHLHSGLPTLNPCRLIWSPSAPLRPTSSPAHQEIGRTPLPGTPSPISAMGPCSRPSLGGLGRFWPIGTVAIIYFLSI